MVLDGRDMVHVVKMEGTSSRLYSCIAPLVMNPQVIKYNHNYPFKTGEEFIWFVAFQQERVVGFFPVEIKKQSVVINNYYVSGDEKYVFVSLLSAVVKEFANTGKTLAAVVQKVHESYFQMQGFEADRTWRLYVKMKKKDEK